MALPKSKIISTQQLIQQIIESCQNGERFCFILGSGASVESGIPSGSSLEMRWMDCIMGISSDLNTPALDVNTSREYAKKLYEEKLISYSFDELESAWKEAKDTNLSLSSTYYFDIYKLRFYPNTRNGYRYLEHIMEHCEPSLGYHTLALLLTKNTLTNQCSTNNLIITTNFDSLVEDALFLYTDKKPLVAGHEALANYIESNIQRPIIAKIHRGLMYAPFNNPEHTNNLKKEWKEVLNYAFSNYTPIVIGYGGGDRSLMSYLEETNALRHGIYWCYRGNPDFLENNIINLISKKNGYLVTIDGFDSLMLEIGKKLYPDEITPYNTEIYLRNQCEQRLVQYNMQWRKLNNNTELNTSPSTSSQEILMQENTSIPERNLTDWDYRNLGLQAYSNGNYQEAIESYTMAIRLRDGFASDYNSRGKLYEIMGKRALTSQDFNNATKMFNKAISDYNRAISLNPHFVEVYYNLGVVYFDLEQYERSIENFTIAIKIKPDYIDAYNNRGSVYHDMEQYEKAIEDFSKIIELSPDFSLAYNNRGCEFFALKEYGMASTEYEQAIELDPLCPIPHLNYALLFYTFQQYTEAIEELSKAIELDPKYKEAYLERAKIYRTIGEYKLAEVDEQKAATLA